MTHASFISPLFADSGIFGPDNMAGSESQGYWVTSSSCRDSTLSRSASSSLRPAYGSSSTSSSSSKCASVGSFSSCHTSYGTHEPKSPFPRPPVAACHATTLSAGGRLHARRRSAHHRHRSPWTTRQSTDRVRLRPAERSDRIIVAVGRRVARPRRLRLARWRELMAQVDVAHRLIRRSVRGTLHLASLVYRAQGRDCRKSFSA